MNKYLKSVSEYIRCTWPAIVFPLVIMGGIIALVYYTQLDIDRAQAEFERSTYFIAENGDVCESIKCLNNQCSLMNCTNGSMYLHANNFQRIERVIK